jgi:hypothetical protein
MDGLVKTRLIGQAKLKGQALMCFGTHNLVRLGAIGGRWDAHQAKAVGYFRPKRASWPESRSQRILKSQRRGI